MFVGTGKRSAMAAVHIATSMVKENLITEREALLRIKPGQLEFFLYPMVDPSFNEETNPDAKNAILGKGLCASSGAASGKVVFTCHEATTSRNNGEKCILCREDTSAEDIAGMQAAEGVVTSRGGLTVSNIP